MTAYVAIEPHPYFAITGDHGSFKIAGVPAGRYSVARGTNDMAS